MYLLWDNVVTICDDLGLGIKITKQLVGPVRNSLDDGMSLNYNHQAVGSIQLSLKTASVHIRVSEQDLELRLRPLVSSGLATFASSLREQ